jgi:hypothetical protein
MTVISLRERALVGYPPFTIDDAQHVTPRSAPSMRDGREAVTVALDELCDLRDERCRVDRKGLAMADWARNHTQSSAHPTYGNRAILSQALRGVISSCSYLPERMRKTTFTLAWRAPDAQQADPVGKSIAALVISSDKKRRRDAEVYLENSSTRRWL